MAALCYIAGRVADLRDAVQISAWMKGGGPPVCILGRASRQREQQVQTFGGGACFVFWGSNEEVGVAGEE